MPTEISRPPAPVAPRAQLPRRGPHEVTSSSLTPLAIIAALILVLHVAGSILFAAPRAHAFTAAPDVDANCLDVAPQPPSLPFD